MKFTSATPYIASYVLLKKDGKVAFVLRSHTGWMDGKYSLVAGKVENDETYIQAAVREAKEEAGVDIQVDDLKQVMTMHRREPDMDWVDVLFETDKWQGVVTNGEPTLHDVVDWFALDKLPPNIVPNIKFAVEQLLQGKIYCEYGWEN